MNEIVGKFNPLQHLKYIAYFDQESTAQHTITINEAFKKKYLKEIQDNFFTKEKLLPHRTTRNHELVKQFITNELSECNCSTFLAIYSLYIFMDYATDGNKFVTIMPNNVADFEKFLQNYDELDKQLPYEDLFNFYVRATRSRFKALCRIHGESSEPYKNSLEIKKQKSKELIEMSNQKEENSTYY